MPLFSNTPKILLMLVLLGSAFMLQAAESAVVEDDLNALEGDEKPVAVPVPVDVSEVPQAVVCEGGSVCRETSTHLPLRVLPRPFSNLYKQPVADKAQLLRANLPAFRPWYVFQRKDLDLSDPLQAKGWYQVGSDTQNPKGWIRAQDAFEWRQALMVSYTHPGEPGEGRYPVLMFAQKAPLQALLEVEDSSEVAQGIYDNIEAGNIPDTVVSMEPKQFVNINENFYLLPILQFETVDIEGDEARLLQLAAAVPGARGATPLSGGSNHSTNGAPVEKMNVDVVFVMDTTRSMQPYIDMTRDAVTRMVQQLSGSLNERVRFGLVGYRDSLEVIPKLEYTTRNFTPELVKAEQLVKVLSEQAKAATVGSKDYQEEVYAGVDAALNSAWRENTLKFIILIGDASSHEPGHPQSTTVKSAKDLSRDLQNRQIYLMAMHIRNPKAAKDFARAEAQLDQLASVSGGSGESMLIRVSGDKLDDFATAVNTMTRLVSDAFQRVLDNADKGRMEDMLMQADATGGNSNAPEQQVEKAFRTAWNSALIEYLGRSAKPPKDIVAWVLDRDLVDPSIRSLDVRVLINRKQLSSLVQALDRVIQALMLAEVTQEQFFQALQGVAGQTMKRPEDIGQAQKIVDTGLLPAFINSLPYKSDILSLSDEMYASMSADDRARLQWSLLAKLKQYREINERVDAWQKLNDTDANSEMVYPLNIDYLP